MAAREERVEGLAGGPRVIAPMASPPRRAVWAAAGLALLAGALFAVRCDLPGFFDNEGRYAEVAREMVQSGDWVTPRLDGTLFLNKPPLAFWLAAFVYQVAGPSEWARLASVFAAVVAILAVCRIGALLWDEATGLVAGVMMATMIGVALEARTLRPDMTMTATLAVALLCWLHARRGERGWLVGLWAALGVGMLAKGFVPVVLAAMPIGVLTLAEEGWRGVGRLRPWLGLGVMAAIVAPWHVAVALQHPGFAWDYVVNQHLLFFLDKKPTRDSEGDALWFFWAAFALRALPWTLLFPLTLGEAARGAQAPAGTPERGTFFLWVWVGGTLLFFSCAPSRLEHYSIPALPAAALLAARVWGRARDGDLPDVHWQYLRWLGLLLGLSVIGGGSLSRFLDRVYWLGPAMHSMVLETLAVFAGFTLTVVGCTVALAATWRRPGVLVGAFALGMIPMAWIVLRAEIQFEPLFSWRPVAEAIGQKVPAGTEIVFEAPVEYQQVAGLAFYTKRPITLLAHPAFVPPTYLAGLAGGMFLPRDAFARRWADDTPLVLVSDPQQRRDTPDAIAPAPFDVVAHFGDRWVLSNHAAR